MSEKYLDNKYYEAYYTDNMSSNITVVFSSAGALALAEPIEEFKKTIRNFDTSYIFVRSKYYDWYNNDATIETFKLIGVLCDRFKYVYAIGESLGGSGALFFSKYYKNTTRIMAFSPQYSALPEFCKWQGPLTPIDGTINTYLTSDYAPEEAVGKSVLIFPTTANEDNLHAKFFKAEGFNVVFVRTRRHDLAKVLKTEYKSNYLILVLNAMYDHRKKYDENRVYDILNEISERSLKTYQKWIGNNTFGYKTFIDIPDSGIISNESSICTLSSTCEYSHSQDKNVEAKRGILEPLRMIPAFHTDKELHPWWMIDLLSICEISHIVIFNRCDNEEFAWRFKRFYVTSSKDLKEWNEIYRKNDMKYVGGEYGEPVLIKENFFCRYIKITLNELDYLHLSKIIIYGKHL